eukprot:Gb_22010 [translate_table: standard]
MNTSGSSGAHEQCTGPNWATESSNWDHNSAVTALEPRVHYQGNHHNNSTSNRLDWDCWDNTMLLSHNHNHHHNHAQHHNHHPISAPASAQGDHGDRKAAHMTGAAAAAAAAATLVNSGIRSSFDHGVLQSGFASNLSHVGHPMGGLFSGNPVLRSFAGMENSSAGGIHFLSGLPDIVKRESIEGFNRIGLNLGGRTYFSTEDSGVGRLVKRPRSTTPGSQVPMCQAEGCKADLSSAKHYHRRHKVCEQHSKAATVITGGLSQRFCQQCSRFHVLGEFDDGKRSCRKRLADHNRRRRKPQSNNDVARIGNGESPPLKDDVHDSSTNNRSTGSQVNSMPGSDSQALLSAISLSPPVSLMIQSNNNNNNHTHRQQLSMVSGSAQDPMYQYLQVNIPQSGPQLSLSSLGPGITINEDQWRQHRGTGRKYECIDHQPSVPWLRHHVGSSNDSVTRSAINLQPLMASKSSDNNSASSNGSCSQVFSPVQNLLPIQSSRSGSGLSNSGSWVMSNMQQTTHNREHSNTQYGISNMNVHGSLEGQQVLSLLESSTLRDVHSEGTGRQQQQRAPVEFLQQQTSSSETESSQSGSGEQGDVKFPDLQTLRPFGSSSIYDANTSLL